MDIILRPIAFVHSPVAGPKEDYWGEVVSEIELAAHLSPDALQGLNDFSHIEVLFHFHRLSEDAIISGCRHPRGNANWPEVGIFAQRAKARPNRLAATICQVVAVKGRTITVKGLDALNGSPVVDIKPVLAEFLPDKSAMRQPKWSHEMMANYFAQ